MAKLNLKKPLRLMEDFMAGEISKPQDTTAPAVKTDSKTISLDKKSQGEKVRAEIVKDVDTILTNLETLSKQITESVLNESLEEILKGIMSKVAAAQGEAYLQKYTPLLKAANQNLIDARIFALRQPLEDTIAKLSMAKGKAKGSAKKPLISKIEKERQKIAKLEARKEELKAAADAKVEKLKVKMTKAEGQMVGALKERYMALKAKVTSEVNLEGLKAKAKVALAKENKEAADKIALEMQELADNQKAIEDKIKKGEIQSKEDLAELDGIKPFMNEISFFADANQAADVVKQKIIDAARVYESLEERLDYLDIMILEGDIMTLYTGAKKEGNVADLSKVKTFAAELKKVEAEVYKAKKALYDKVASTTVTNKSIIDLAGGDTEKAGGKEGEWKMGELKAKWGGAEGFVAPEEYAPLKNIQEIEDNIDQAIEDAELKGQGGDDKAKSVEDVAKEKLGDGFDDYKGPFTKEETKAKEPIPATEDGGEPTEKDKYTDIQGPFKAKDEEGNDTGDEKYYAKLNDSQSAATVDGTDLEEGNEFGAARAEAIAKGEKTFKVGDEEYPVEDVSKDDKENAEEFVEEAKEELPKKIKLYEGMSVADKFKALM